jgi:hypothetical protein
MALAMITASVTQAESFASGKFKVGETYTLTLDSSQQLNGATRDFTGVYQGLHSVEKFGMCHVFANKHYALLVRKDGGDWALLELQ